MLPHVFFLTKSQKLIFYVRLFINSLLPTVVVLEYEKKTRKKFSFFTFNLLGKTFFTGDVKHIIGDLKVLPR
jgi:hypothetical protein